MELKMWTNQNVIGNHIQLADSFLVRLIGLMGVKKLEKGQGMLLRKCTQIHTVGMNIPLDVVVLSSDDCILGLHEYLKPWRLGPKIRGTAHVLELPAVRGC